MHSENKMLEMTENDLIQKLIHCLDRLNGILDKPWDRYAITMSNNVANDCIRFISLIHFEDSNMTQVKSRTISELSEMKKIHERFYSAKHGFDTDLFENRSIQFDAIASPTKSIIYDFLSVLKKEQSR